LRWMRDTMGFFRLFYRPYGWVTLGIIIIVYGAALYRDGLYRALPKRAELEPLVGVVENVSKTTKQKLFGDGTLTEYHVNVRNGDGGAITLIFPEKKLSDQIAEKMHGMPIVALPRGTNGRGGAWELKAGETTLLDFDTERQRFADALAEERWNAPFIIAGGLAVMLAGIYRMYRRRRAASAFS
jgi:hypothetical protein